ncbi:MAG: hypothetical protein ACT4NY_25100 [Pseudonocardiales bacterium]
MHIAPSAAYGAARPTGCWARPPRAAPPPTRLRPADRFSGRSTSDHDDILGLLDRLVRIVLPVRAEQGARDTQRRLVERGQHRAVGVADLLVAAAAKEAGLTVLHYDGDFDLVASVTGQSGEWIVPAGTAD